MEGFLEEVELSLNWRDGKGFVLYECGNWESFPAVVGYYHGLEV